MVKGLCCSAMFPSLSLYFAGWSNLSQGFCGWGGNLYSTNFIWWLTDFQTFYGAGYGIGYHLATAFVVWIGSDFYEFAYHRLGHVSFPFWKQHKHHHVFFNPSPFAVIADEWIDQVKSDRNILYRLSPEGIHVRYSCSTIGIVYEIRVSVQCSCGGKFW